MNEKYYKELSRILAKNAIETAPPEKNTLPILLNGSSVCRVEPSGDVCIFPNDVRSPEADELYHRVAPFSRMVKEYMTAIERAPLLKATALDEDYKLLAEFNRAVLAGRETEHGYMFVTWARDYEGTGVICGGYYLDAYEAAKQDFSIRAGMIQNQRLFSNDQLLNIYQSINNTFEAGCELTQEDEKNLSGIQDQITGRHRHPGLLRRRTPIWTQAVQTVRLAGRNRPNQGRAAVQRDEKMVRRGGSTYSATPIKYRCMASSPPLQSPRLPPIRTAAGKSGQPGA